ncbi:hypothetical protein [Lactobacillus sp. 3B(2020)]|uniref:hypothetical protein n=1 Tax=Lactobacillus sp. 3B(2020) TaxID=2695882 RepID=UPI0015DDAC6A|nr:hypothetical protein [Lactobacillus sp. 3B(2020)]QLL69460.1 hypothetical protein GTO83_02340 [Lactobacillus sp. 3B(2020)]
MLFNLNGIRKQSWKETAYEPICWENVLFLAHYATGKTFVMKANGAGIVYAKSVREVINEFATKHHIHQLMTDVFYSGTSNQVSKALVRGKYALVPSGGLKNENTIFYMSHLVIDTHYDPQVGMILCFKDQTGDGSIKLVVEVSKATFLRHLDTAVEVGKTQLEFKDNCLKLFGSTSIWEAETSAERTKLERLEKIRIKTILIQFSERVYGEVDLKECEEFVERYLFKPYRI